MAFPDSTRKAPTVFLEVFDDTGSPGSPAAGSVTSIIIINAVPLPPTPVPVVDFVGVPVTGTEPLSVAFTDLSTNSPNAWQWDFENIGSVDSTLENPTHIYPFSGIYSVKLTAYNTGGSSSLVKIGYIIVTDPAPQPITYMPFLMNEAPGFDSELTLMPFRMGIGLEFENPEITLMPFLVDNGSGFENPTSTIMPFVMTNAVAFTNPSITLMPFLVDNGSGFENPVSTIMPFVVDYGAGFENPAITVMPFLVDNGSGFENPVSTIMPFTMNRV